MYLNRLIQNLILIFLLCGLTGNAFAVKDKKSAYRVGDHLQEHAALDKSTYKEVKWDDLMPKDWDPQTDFNKLDFSKLQDSDPRAQEALMQLREAWNNAPVEPSMDGASIRIPGFIVPLEVAKHQITEFLLVPFFGACIHVPPPPANQIIHVFPSKPLKKGLQSMDTVWISGKLEAILSSTDMGTASYRMKADIVEPYKN